MDSVSLDTDCSDFFDRNMRFYPLEPLEFICLLCEASSGDSIISDDYKSTKLRRTVKKLVFCPLMIYNRDSKEPNWSHYS